MKTLMKAMFVALAATALAVALTCEASATTEVETSVTRQTVDAVCETCGEEKRFTVTTLFNGIEVTQRWAAKRNPAGELLASCEGSKQAPEFGTQINPWNFSQLAEVEGVAVVAIDGGYTVESKDENGRWADVWFRICGNQFGAVDYSQLGTENFISRNLVRGEAMVIRLFEGTIWFQQQPTTATLLNIGTTNLRRVDANGYGWTFTPSTSIAFVVPGDANIDAVQAGDAEFLPGQQAIVGTYGATVWFSQAQPINSGQTTYVVEVQASRVVHVDEPSEPTDEPTETPTEPSEPTEPKPTIPEYDEIPVILTEIPEGDGTAANPYSFQQLLDEIEGIEVRYLGGGYQVASRNSDGGWRNIRVRICGEQFGFVQSNHSANSEHHFTNRELCRGDVVTVRLYEGTFWLQQQPIVISSITFRTGGMRRADAGGFGWVYRPAETIQFVVPDNQSIDLIQVGYDMFKPGDTVTVTPNGATIWFTTAQAVDTRRTTYGARVS